MKKDINLNKIDESISLHGLDIGNAICKSHKRKKFQAKLTTVEPLKTADKLFIDGKTYYLGYGNYDTTYRKIDKKHYIDMMYGLLALNTDTVHNYVCLGLPLGQYKEDYNTLISLVMSNSDKIVKINDIEKPLIIEDCEIFPEGISTIKDNEECIVVDIGGGSTDCGLVVNERGTRKIINPISIPKGTIKLYEGFANKLNNKYGLDIDLEEAERILNRRILIIDGNKVDIDFALEEYKEYSELLISKLQLNYPVRTNNISLTGGGAEIARQPLLNRFKDSLKVQDDFLFANAKNYYELGLSLFDMEE